MAAYHLALTAPEVDSLSWLVGRYHYAETLWKIMGGVNDDGTMDADLSEHEVWQFQGGRRGRWVSAVLWRYAGHKDRAAPESDGVTKKLTMDAFEDFIVISRYTRQQAIEDGVLVDISAQARETGILLPTVLTDHLQQVLEDIPAESRGQDYRGRCTTCSG